jgi:hypothetical protein
MYAPSPASTPASLKPPATVNVLTRQLVLDAVESARKRTPGLMRPSADAAASALRKYVSAKGAGEMTPEEAMAIYTQLPSFFLLTQPALRIERTPAAGPSDLSIQTRQGFTSWYWLLTNFTDATTKHTVGFVLIVLQLSLDASLGHSLWQVIGGATTNTAASMWVNFPVVTLRDADVRVTRDASGAGEVAFQSAKVSGSLQVSSTGFAATVQYAKQLGGISASVTASSRRGPTYQQPGANATVAPGGVQSAYWSIVDGVVYGTDDGTPGAGGGGTYNPAGIPASGTVPVTGTPGAGGGGTYNPAGIPASGTGSGSGVPGAGGSGTYHPPTRIDYGTLVPRSASGIGIPSTASAGPAYGAAWLDYKQLGMAKPIPFITTFLSSLKPKSGSAQWLWSAIQTPGAQFAFAISDPWLRSAFLKRKTVTVHTLNIWQAGQAPRFNRTAQVTLLTQYPSTDVPYAIQVWVPELGVMIAVESYVNAATPATIMSDVIRAYESPSRVTMWHSAGGARAAGYGVIEWNVDAKLPGFQSALESPVPGIKKSYAPSAYTILAIIAVFVGIVMVIVGAVLIADAVERKKRMRTGTDMDMRMRTPMSAFGAPNGYPYGGARLR